VTIAGSGVGGNGALRNVAGNNAISGTMSLASDAQINVDAGSLTLNGAVKGPGFNLTKAGTGMLALPGSSTSFPASLAVAGGTLRLQNSSALGSGSSITVAGGALVQLQYGINVPSGASLALSGVGSGSGSLENVQGYNTWSGPVSLAADSTIGVDSASDTLVLGGPISGNAALTKAGPGTLQLSSTASSFTGALSVLAGTLRLSSVNSLGAGLQPVALGSSGNNATLWYTGSSGSTNRGLTLAADSTEQCDIDSQAANLTLNGATSGNGNLNKTGNGTLNLAGGDTHTGTTTVSSGTLVVSGGFASTNVTVAGNFTIYNAHGVSNATVNLSSGTLGFSNDGSSNNTFSETIGLLNLAGNSNICTSQAGSGSTSTLTLGRLSRSPGAFVSLTGVGLGASTRNALTITDQPTGIIGNWATSGNDWVKYAQIGSTGVYSVVPFQATDYATTDESHWTAAYWPAGVYPKLTGGTTTLSASTDRTISTLNLAPTAAMALDIPDGRTLHIDGGTASGGNVISILISGSSLATIAASGTNGTGAITAGMANQSGEMVVQQNSTAAAVIGASITDNGSAAYPVMLMKEGPGALILSGSNTYTGGTFVECGVLDIADGNAIPPGTNLTVGSGGTLIFDPGFIAGNYNPAFSGQAAYGPGPAQIPVTAQNSVSTVPEPGALALLAAGCVGLVVMSFQRRFMKRPRGG